jgi:hypothetical protein
MIKKGTRVTGLVFLLLSFFVIGVSAYVYQQATMTVTQTIVEVATITVDNSVLGSINEGETIAYTKATVATLGDAVTIDIQSQPVYLYFDSDLDSLLGSYSTYNITVKFIEVQGGTYAVGDNPVNMTLVSPDPAAITLDAIGLWRFDFEITTTADSVDADIPTTATIVVSADST